VHRSEILLLMSVQGSKPVRLRTSTTSPLLPRQRR